MSIERRPAPTHTFSCTEAGAVPGKTVDLDTDALLLGILVRVHGAITIGTADCTAWTGNTLRAVNLLKNMALLGDGKEKYMENCDLAQLVRRSGILAGQSLEHDWGALYTTAASPESVDVSAFIPFYPQNYRGAPHPDRPAFGLPAYLHDKLQLRFDERPLQEVMTPDTTTALSVSGLLLDVMQIVKTDFDPAKRYQSCRYLGDTLALSAAGTGHKLDLRGDYILRSIFLDVINNTIPSDTIVGNVDLKIKRQGQTIIPVSDDWDALLQDMEARSGFDRLAHAYTTSAGGVLLMLDEGNGEGVESLAGASYAKLEPTITTAPTATAEIKAVKEIIQF